MKIRCTLTLRSSQSNNIWMACLKRITCSWINIVRLLNECEQLDCRQTWENWQLGWFQETKNFVIRYCKEDVLTPNRIACWNTTGSAKAVALLLILAASAPKVKWFSIRRESINRPCEGERRHKTHQAVWRRFRFRPCEPGDRGHGKQRSYLSLAVTESIHALLVLYSKSFSMVFWWILPV